jgi:hypothetical protein
MQLPEYVLPREKELTPSSMPRIRLKRIPRGALVLTAELLQVIGA